MSNSNIRFDDSVNISEIAKHSRLSKRKREENERLNDIKSKLNLDIDTPENADILTIGEEQENEYLDGYRIEPLNMKQEIKEGLIDRDGVIRIDNFEHKPKKKKPKGYEESDSDDENDEWFKSISEQGEKGIANVIRIDDKKADDSKQTTLWDSPISALNELYDLLEDDNDTLAQLLIRNAPKKKRPEPRRSKMKSKQQQSKPSAFESIQSDENLFNRLMELSSYIMNEINVYIDDHKKEGIKKLIDKEKSKMQ